jgi:hypothetical protein
MVCVNRPLFFSVLRLIVCLCLPISFPLVCNCISVLVSGFYSVYLKDVTRTVDRNLFILLVTLLKCMALCHIKFSELCWYRLISWDVIVTDILKHLEG